MNLGKSIKIALAQREKTATWLGGELEMSTPQICEIIRNSRANSRTIEKIAGALDISASQLIALGEAEYESK